MPNIRIIRTKDGVSSKDDPGGNGIAAARVGAAAGLLGGAGNLAYGFFSPYIGRLADLQQTTLTFGLVGLLPWLALLAILQSQHREQ